MSWRPAAIRSRFSGSWRPTWKTPVSVYLKLRNGGPSFLLESVEKGEQLGRYSFLGVRPPLTLCAQGDQLVIGAADGTMLERRQGDPFAAVRSLLAERRPVEVPGLPRFSGGAVGYFGYDTVRFIERLPQTARRKLAIPDMLLLFSDNLVVFDHVKHKLLVIANMRIEGQGPPTEEEIGPPMPMPPLALTRLSTTCVSR